MKIRIGQYVWKDYDVKRLKKPNRTKGTGGENWEPDPMFIKKGFLRNYIWQLLRVAFVGAVSLALAHFTLHHFVLFIWIRCGGLIYMFLVLSGIIAPVALPIKWFVEYRRMMNVDKLPTDTASGLVGQRTTAYKDNGTPWLLWGGSLLGLRSILSICRQPSL